MKKKKRAMENWKFKWSGAVFSYTLFFFLSASLSVAQSCLPTYSWPVPSSANTGQVFYEACSLHEFLSDGTNLLPCEWTGDRKTVSGHEYVCTKSGQGGWVECSGGEAPRGNQAGASKITGQSATYTRGQQFLLAPQQTSYTTNGDITLTSSTTWTVPAGTSQITITIVGGGGGGGGGSDFGYYSGWGGGAAQSATHTIAVTPSQSFSVVVGAGGAGGGSDRSSGFPGGAGGSTSFGSFSVGGGAGGGSASCRAGCLYYGGEYGNECQAFGSPRSCDGDNGVSSSYGTGGAGGAENHHGIAGSPGTGNGAGGGGGGACADCMGPPGGAGSRGKVRITWTSTLTTTFTMSSTPPPANPGTGQALLYCTPEKTFVEDLDSTAQQSTCSSAGYKATGSFCCQEPEDGAEYYNDVKGCWNGVEQTSGNFLSPSLFFSNGQFRGCAIGPSNFDAANNNLLSIQDQRNSRALVIDYPYCTIEGSYFCSYREQWISISGRQVSSLKEIPNALGAGEIQKECCGAEQCWGGTSCVSDQSASTTQPNHRGAFRCLQGGWQERTLRTSPLGATGYCPTNEQCLLDPSASLPCIDSGKYVGNNICLSGDWSTRTKEVALELLRREGSGTFTLYCDSPSKILNKGGISFSSTALSLIQNSIQTPCILTKGEKTVLGLAFTSPPSSTLLQAAFSTNCALDTLNDNAFHACTSRLQRNNATQLYLYSNQNFQLSSGTEQNLIARLVQLVQTIRNRLLGTTTPPYNVQSAYETQLQQFPVFNKLYVSEHTSGRKIFGVYRDDASLKQAVINYENFDDNICAVVQDYATRKLEQQPESGSGIACTNEGKNYAILMQGGGPFLNFNPEAAWEDFTAKVRIS